MQWLLESLHLAAISRSKYRRDDYRPITLSDDLTRESFVLSLETIGSTGMTGSHHLRHQTPMQLLGTVTTVHDSLITSGTSSLESARTKTKGADDGLKSRKSTGHWMQARRLPTCEAHWPHP